MKNGGIADTMKEKYKNMLLQRKGVAGLNIFLAVIAMLFMIGILVMVFILAGSQLSAQVDDATASASINATITALDTATDWFATFITLAALVVLVLLVVIIINSIRGAGIMGGA